ncbi:alpha/beta hydrolase [Thalassospira mesophila]|uniref:Esterase n=1 Tax=Thalassospira mesophila TaxID=1293891 RepID=A0A1Y2KWB2_9PROT|nr:alpha/beta hydrolase [Thalassospira mesophila]OSQ36404.1 esterase [Thalassospira mesophila]
MITDWDDAYANGDHIENAASYPPAWVSAAGDFRNDMLARGQAKLDVSYGEDDREKYDLFLPEGTPIGLVVFVHGGYWKAFDKSYWSHLGNGPVKRGWAVCLPSYSLAPNARLTDITRQIGRAIDHVAGTVTGPVHLTGHSAGGHLVSRMVCEDSPLLPGTLTRIGHVMSISGLHDLRPLRKTTLNNTLKIDANEARTESAALLLPAQPGGNAAQITCWIGANERPEFIRQNDLLANIWTGLGATTQSIHAPDKHHFNVIDALADPQSDMTCCLLAGISWEGE